MKPIELAYYILQNHDNITPLKLQKLLYYCKVWGVVSGENLVDGEFKKWQYGPVNEEVYKEFKKYGDSAIPKHITELTTAPSTQKEIIDLILYSYKPYDAITLSAMTHHEDPWKKVKPCGTPACRWFHQSRNYCSSRH